MSGQNQDREYQIVEKPSQLSVYVTNIILGIIGTAIIAQAALSVQQIKDIGIIQYQLAEIKTSQTTFLTKSEAEQHTKLRNMQLTAIEARISALERTKGAK